MFNPLRQHHESPIFNSFCDDLADADGSSRQNETLTGNGERWTFGGLCSRFVAPALYALCGLYLSIAAIRIGAHQLDRFFLHHWHFYAQVSAKVH